MWSSFSSVFLFAFISPFQIVHIVQVGLVGAIFDDNGLQGVYGKRRQWAQ
jgi:hypothetical protein